MKKKLRRIGLVVLLCCLLAACSAGGDSTPSLTLTPAPSAEVTAGVPTASLEPAATKVPTQVQGKVILVAPSQAGALGSALAGLAQDSGLAFEIRPALRPEEIQAEVRLVIMLQALDDLAALTAAAPQTQFLVVTQGGPPGAGGSDLQAAGNLSVIRQLEVQRTFMAGYITTIIAPDWRAAGLLPDAPADLQDAFINGGRYWCGRCIPVYAPLVLFPLAGTQPAGTDAAGWQSTLQELQQKVLEAVYISPAADSSDLLQAIAGQKLIMVGTQLPEGASPEVKAAWAVTLSFDPLPAIQKMWPDLAAGKGGQTADASLNWTDVNADIFTVGKQRLAQEALDGLLDGTIGPLSVPAE